MYAQLVRRVNLNDRHEIDIVLRLSRSLARSLAIIVRSRHYSHDRALENRAARRQTKRDREKSRLPAP